MDLNFLFRGMILGLSIAAPVGPIGIMCIRRTLKDGRSFGFMSGFGAASADALYASIAAFGVTLISNILIAQQLWLGIIGGIFLSALGIQIFFSKPELHSSNPSKTSLPGAFLSTFLLTLSNPIPILSFAAIFAGVSAASETGGYISAALLVIGVFSGSLLWWFALSWIVSLLRTKINQNFYLWINRAAGVMLFIYGIVILVRLFSRLT